MSVKPQPVRGAARKKPAILIFGIPGSGKTRFISTAPDTLIIRPPIDHTDSIDSGNAEEVVVDDWTSMYEVRQELHQGNLKYKWVWLDSISLFQEVGLADVFADAIARKASRAEYGPDKGEYHVNMLRLGQWVRDLVSLAKAGKFSFGITAYPFEWYDPEKEEDVWAPYVQGANMSPKICGYMNFVGYLKEVRKKDKSPSRVLLTDSPGFVGKDQYNCMPELGNGKHGLVNPTVPKLEKLIAASKGSGRTNAKKTRRTRKGKS